MTIEERFERIERLTAGMAEERLRDREDRKLWRDTQRQIDQLTQKIGDMGDELRASDRRLGDRIEEVNKRLGSRIDEVDKRLGERIESLVSAMGEFLARQNGGKQ